MGEFSLYPGMTSIGLMAINPPVGARDRLGAFALDDIVRRNDQLPPPQVGKCPLRNPLY